MRILLLDHSVVAYKSFWRIFSEEYAGETDDESYEFTRSYCGLIQFFVELFKADAVMWLLDCERADVWRHEIVDDYYLPRTEIWANVDDATLAELSGPEAAETFMGRADGIYRKVWTGPDGELHGKHLTKKTFDIAAEDWDLSAREIQTPSEVFDRVAQKIIPKYKGNREGSHWPRSAVLDKRTFQSISLKLASQLAPHFNGKIARGANLEADDLAYAAVQKYKNHELIAVTTDSDWAQLALMHPNIKIFDPNQYELMDTDPDKVKHDMFVKLMSGDKSDNIKSVRLEGKAVGIGDKKAKELLQEHGVGGIRKFLLENCERATLEKNTDLINLKRAPDAIKARAEVAIADAVAPKETQPLTFFVSMATLELAKSEAQQLAAKWELTGANK